MAHCEKTAGKDRRLPMGDLLAGGIISDASFKVPSPQHLAAFRILRRCGVTAATSGTIAEVAFAGTGRAWR